MFHSDAGFAAPPEPKVHTVLIDGMKFIPDTISVRPGDTVVWVNKDLFPHTATAVSKRFDSHEIEAGKSWKYVAKKTGEFAYFCTLHPVMKGTLLVK